MEHIFSNHYLKPIHRYPIFNSAPDLIWPSLILLFCFSLFVYLRIAAPYKVAMTFRSSYNIQAIKQLEREEFNPLNLRSYALNLIYLISITFFVYKLNETYCFILEGVHSFLQFLFLWLCIALYHGLKYLLRWVIGFVGNTQALMMEILYNNMVINQTVGMLMLPAIIAIEFSKIEGLYLFVATALILLTAFFIKIYRGFIFSVFENQIGLLQVFVYICALEILPFLVFAKLMITNF